MKDQNDRIEMLNNLVQINEDRISTYEEAMREIKESPNEKELDDLFRHMIDHSLENIEELGFVITNLGGKTDTSTTTRGKFYRVWMDIKTALTDNDTASAIQSCEYSEEATQRAYSATIDSGLLDEKQVSMVLTQEEKLSIDLERLKAW